jgi:hypothetical protein
MDTSSDLLGKVLETKLFEPWRNTDLIRVEVIQDGQFILHVQALDDKLKTIIPSVLGQVGEQIGYPSVHIISGSPDGGSIQFWRSL